MSDVKLVLGSQLKIEPIDWVWHGWLAKGKVHIFGGAPGTGKTTLALALGAILTQGGKWPDGTSAEQGGVLIWSGEDDAPDTLGPRLVAAGANMNEVAFITETSHGDLCRPFDPAQDMPLLLHRLSAMEGIALIIIDPIVSAVKGDGNKNSDVRRDLAPLVDLAARKGAAVLGITHFSKGTQDRSPVERITGSIAFSALARIVLVASKEPGNTQQRCFMRAKSNIGPDEGGFRYTLEPATVRAHDGRPVETTRITWQEAIDGSADALLQEAVSKSGPPPDDGKMGKCAKWLSEMLASGPMSATEVKEAAEAAGYPYSTVHRVAATLNVQKHKSGMHGGWNWELPGLGGQIGRLPPGG